MTSLCTLLKSGSDVLVQIFTVVIYRPLFQEYADIVYVYGLCDGIPCVPSLNMNDAFRTEEYHIEEYFTVYGVG
ncbi:hypothetical protein ANN_06111 [Periplaneta americana]|uniref:Uncharacterized protein n=1 Tax=Periplaneta americana TaxID=6978 RepID=A0ABQ8TEE8_PERAM|nr:hypothetical protein ANN_06111 [Periplaneta americana]